MKKPTKVYKALVGEVPATAPRRRKGAGSDPLATASGMSESARRNKKATEANLGGFLCLVMESDTNIGSSTICRQDRWKAVPAAVGIHHYQNEGTVT